MRKVYKTYELEEEMSLYIKENDIWNNINKEKHGSLELNIILTPDEEKIDTQIEKDFLDDIDIVENESIEQRNEKVKRYQKIVKVLKQKYNYKCQLCGYTFLMHNGSYYCEAHHIKMLSKGGSQHPENVVILCANHHRIFHYASNTIIVGELIDSKRVIKIKDEEFAIQF